MASNSFGEVFRFSTWGESHGPAIGCVVDGVPPRLPVSETDIQFYLDRRKPGQNRFTTQRQEPDQVKILLRPVPSPARSSAPGSAMRSICAARWCRLARTR